MKSKQHITSSWCMICSVCSAVHLQEHSLLARELNETSFFPTDTNAQLLENEWVLNQENRYRGHCYKTVTRPEVLIRVLRHRERTLVHSKTENDEEEKAGLCPKSPPMVQRVLILLETTTVKSHSFTLSSSCSWAWLYPISRLKIMHSMWLMNIINLGKIWLISSDC